MNYRLRPGVELLEKNEDFFLISRNPLSMLRLNRALADLVGRGTNDQIITPSAAEAAVMEQLVTKGFVEQIWSVPQLSDNLPFVSIIIPVMDRAEELQRCLDSLSRLSYPHDKFHIIVVDDGSKDSSPQVARDCGALVIPSGGTGRGPAAARNAGAFKAQGDILAFIDSDCCASSAWLNELIPAFTDENTAAVGGQVDGLCSDSAVDRYEAVMSSLSLGSRVRSGNRGHDTFYLPSCNLLVRASAFRQAGGFKEEMHVGEDVDLTWRLRDKAWTICYLPAGNVLHEHRSTIRSFMSRRFDYGTSEGMLQLLHPRRHKQMVIPPLLASVLALCIISPFCGGLPLLLAGGLLAADATSVKIRIARQGLPIGLFTLLAGRLRALGSLVYYLSFHLVRYYTSVMITVALFVPAVWGVFSMLLLCSAGVDYAIKKPRLSFPFFTGIYFLEHFAYGVGVFWGCLRRKCFSSYRVVILKQAEAAS
ncbi:MAG TPA: mycofactocin system glycosyltransferase [Desulfuromonadales bacterium]|nr:mycofactocin system glycosyltransferase [Desulfuromonadales bacterium]